MKKLFFALIALIHFSDAYGMYQGLNMIGHLLSDLYCSTRVSNSTGATIPYFFLGYDEKRSLQLGQAAADGDSYAVQQSLANGTDANKEYYHTGTPLMRALSCPSEVDALEWKTGRHWKTKKTICKMLMKAGAQVNAQSTKDGQTALMKAVKCQFNLVRFLLKHGADANMTDNQGLSALNHAINENMNHTNHPERLEICKQLILFKPQSSLREYIVSNNRDMAKDCIKKGIPIQDCLFDAIYCRDQDITYLLLKLGAQIDGYMGPDKKNALTLAAELKDEALCEILVKYQKQTNPVKLIQLLAMRDTCDNRPFDYSPFDCLNPDSVNIHPKHALVRHEEALQTLLAQDPDTRHCTTPGCTFTYTGEIHKGFERIGSIMREVNYGPMTFPCPNCKAMLTSHGPKGYKATTKLIAKTPVAGACLSMPFAPDLPGFYYMKCNTPYAYVNCGLAALSSAARLEAEIYGQKFSESNFKQMQELIIPDYKNYQLIPGTRKSAYTRQPEIEKLAHTLHLAPIPYLCIRDTEIKIKQAISAKVGQLNDPDITLNQIAQQLQQLSSPFAIHFMCQVPEHVFAISITRNAKGEQAMYLHDGLDDYAEEASYMRRYIEYLYNRFF